MSQQITTSNTLPAAILHGGQQVPAQPRGDFEFHNDIEAVLYCINRPVNGTDFKLSKPTREAYLKEFRRLFWWMAHYAHANHDGRIPSLGELTAADGHHFLAWCAAPQPNDCNTTRLPANHEDWRPLTGALSSSSRKQAHAAFKSVCGWLADTGYLPRNVWRLVDVDTKVQSQRLRSDTASKVFENQHMQWISSWLDLAESGALALPERKLARYRFIFFAYALTGLRMSEFLRNDTGALGRITVGGRGYSVLHITGKGGKDASIPVPEDFMTELMRYRQAMNKSPLPAPMQPEPFIFDLSGKHGITTRQNLHRIVKELLDHVGDYAMTEGSPHDGMILKHASTHWFRHTFVTVGLAETKDLALAQASARHSDPKTTSQYNHASIESVSTFFESVAKQYRGDRGLNETEAGNLTEGS